MRLDCLFCAAAARKSWVTSAGPGPALDGAGKLVFGPASWREIRMPGLSELHLERLSEYELHAKLHLPARVG